MIVLTKREIAYLATITNWLACEGASPLPENFFEKHKATGVKVGHKLLMAKRRDAHCEIAPIQQQKLFIIE